MVLCERKKLDDKCRLLIPTDYIKASGGRPGGYVYVSYDEDTAEIKITTEKEKRNDCPN